jgi:hypothetical protein
MVLDAPDDRGNRFVRSPDDKLRCETKPIVPIALKKLCCQRAIQEIGLKACSMRVRKSEEEAKKKKQEILDAGESDFCMTLMAFLLCC